MKKILLVLMTALFAVSCSDDIFDVDPTGTVSKESRDEIAAEDPDKVLQGTEASIYVHYATYSQGQHWFTGYKGLELTLGMSGQDMAMLMQHSMNLYAYINDYWQEEYAIVGIAWYLFYTPIATANEILATATAEAAEESQGLKEYRARALTSRAFAFYHLINIFQFPYSQANKDLLGVPLSTEFTMGENLPRATMQETYDLIISDLDEALRLFEEVGYDDKASRTDFDSSIAAMIRARVALVMEDWATAEKMADKVLATYPLVPMADFNNGYNRLELVPSAMFGFKMTADNSMSWASWASQMCPYWEGYAAMWAERPIHSYFYEQINKTDVRRAWWLNTTDNPSADPAASGYACVLPDGLLNAPASGIKDRSEYVSVKFRSYNNSVDNTDNIYMRAEEAVFIKAEAQAHTNMSAAKKTLEDYVTTYRDPAYKVEATDVEDFVVNEVFFQKRIEMWMESCIEWMDRRRLGLLIDRREDPAMTAAGIVNNHIYPAAWNAASSLGMRWQLPRSVVIANPEIGEENQNKTE